MRKDVFLGPISQIFKAQVWIFVKFGFTAPVPQFPATLWVESPIGRVETYELKQNVGATC